MAPRKWLIGSVSRALDLSIVRSRSLVRASLFSLIFVAGVTALKSSTNALFLARRDPRDLPYLYLATALAITLVTVYLGQRLSKSGAKSVLRTGVQVSAAVLAVLSVLAALDVRPALGALYVGGEVYATAINVLFWARLGEVFDVRTAKKVFGTAAAAGMAGATIGGLLVKFTAGLFPSVWWCGFAVVTLVLALPLLGQDRGGTAKAQGRQKKISFHSGLAYAAVDRFPRGVALLMLFLAVQTATVDYAFRTGAFHSEGGDEAGLAALFGILNAAVGISAIAFQLLITGPLLRRLGVFVFLSIVPILTIFAGLWSMVDPAWFVPIFLLKTFEMMGSLSLYQPGLQLLYNPMPAQMRDSVRALVDGAIKKLGGAVGGILLILFGSFLEPRVILTIVVGIALLLLLFLRSLRAGYVTALQAKLGKKGVPLAGAIDPSDRSTKESLLKTLEDPDPGRVLTALSVLSRDPSIDLLPHFGALIAHPSEEVRLQAIERIEAAPKKAYAPLLIQVIQGSERRPKAQAAKALELVDHQAAVQVLRPFLDQAVFEGPELGLLAAAIRTHLAPGSDPDAQALAERRLQELLDRRRGTSSERREVARLLGQLGPSPHAVRLATFLDDPEASVRAMAIWAAGQTKELSLVPKLIARLPDRTVRRAATTALSAYGEAVVPALAETLDDRRLLVGHRVLVPKILRMIGTESAGSAMLFSNVQDDAFLRYVIVDELSRLRREHPEIEFERKRTEEAAIRRLRAYAHYLPIGLDLRAGGSTFQLLARAVDDRVRQNLTAGLKVLGLISDPVAMDGAIRGLLAGHHADACELIDMALQGSELRPLVLKALEQSYPTGIPGRAKERAYTLVEGRDVQLAMIAWETLRRLGEEPPEVKEPTQGEPLMPKSIVEKVFVLENVQLFHGLPVDDLAAVAALTTEGHAAPGEIVYREGDPGSSVYVIVSGEVHLLHGPELLMDLYAGDSFGQVSILDQGARPVTAQAGDEGVDYLNLEREAFMDLVADRPEVLNGLFVVLARRLRELVDLSHGAATPTKSAGQKAAASENTIPPGVMRSGG